ncbi:tetratricopeptide repeat protein [Paenibacillus sedimenti]|uniref:tetratricopeptide repeat protein n=1 Tax=Paenibacillus sedimenti TaxID=2770274 RepID=UPI0028A22A23|nr:tetratricopeptide repeat protein [Paenibacillus sedimenti]
MTEINFQTAVAHDNSGLGQEAIPYYERAIEQGLSGPDLERALLGLGSIYRYLGYYQQAEATLRRGVEEFPHNRGLQNGILCSIRNTLMKLGNEEKGHPQRIGFVEKIRKYKFGGNRKITPCLSQKLMRIGLLRRKSSCFHLDDVKIVPISNWSPKSPNCGEMMSNPTIRSPSLPTWRVYLLMWLYKSLCKCAKSDYGKKREK